MYLCTLKTIGMTGQKTPTALGTEKIGKLLMQYAIPAIIAMTASSLYNMVDSIFIGHGVGPMAISGLALTFPLMNLAAAFGSLVGVGAATLISVKLGQKDYDTAQRVLGNVLVLNIIIGLAFTVLTLIFLDPILYFFGGSDETVGYARDYMKVILYGNVITHIYLGLNAVLRSAGHPQKAMVATIATVVINTILDPLFIYGFGWGIQGAAIATITAQVIALAWQFRLFGNKEELLHFHRGVFRLKRKIVLDSLAIGMSPFLMNLASCFIVILINQGLKRYGGGSCHRGIWHCQPSGISIPYDCDGTEPGYAADCRIQLWGKVISPCHSCAETDHLWCDHCHHYRFSDGNVYSRPGSVRLHIARRADSPICRRPPHCGTLFPDCRLSDGHFQFLPEYRDGK